MPDMSFDHILCEIGDRNNLTVADAIKAGQGLRNVIVNTHGAMAIMVGGYDDDPRPLFQIPEVVDYVQKVMIEAGIRHWTHLAVVRLGQATLVLLVLCGVFGEDHPFTAVIVEGADPI